jgi:flavin reductase (DIM6/NTAB) family NADH-FMN oxidoreductase RutF
MVACYTIRAMIDVKAAGPTSDQVRFRQALGRFATGVTVVSTEHEGTVHGMTANGFMSVSLDPLLVLVSIARTARMHDLLERSGHFGVSVLTKAQQELSNHFAGRPMQDAEVPFHAVSGVPLIRDALVEVATRTVDAHRAGDHTLFIGEVLYFDSRDGEPLIFHSGGYRELLGEPATVSQASSWSGFCLEPLDPLASF